MATDPDPDKVCTILNRQRPVMQTYSGRPEISELFEM